MESTSGWWLQICCPHFSIGPSPITSLAYQHRISPQPKVYPTSTQMTFQMAAKPRDFWSKGGGYLVRAQKAPLGAACLDLQIKWVCLKGRYLLPFLIIFSFVKASLVIAPSDTPHNIPGICRFRNPYPILVEFGFDHPENQLRGCTEIGWIPIIVSIDLRPCLPEQLSPLEMCRQLECQ